MANRELEVRLRRLQSSKITPFDFDLTSADSSRAASPTSSKKVSTFDFAAADDLQKSNGYSSSLPTSPNHSKCVSSPLASSVPSSPLRKNDFYVVPPNSWLSVDAFNSPLYRLYSNVFNDQKEEHQVEVIGLVSIYNPLQ